MSEEKIRTVFITLGCKANQYDSAAMMALAPAERFSVIAAGEEARGKIPADCYVINTCAVTERSAFQSRQMVRRVRRWNPEAKVIVMGCLAAVDRNSLLAAGADLVAGPPQTEEIAEFFTGRENTPPDFFYDPTGGRQKRGRAVVKIQDGCNNRCSYCVVPLARGRERSLPPALVKEELKRLAERGFCEAVLTGINLGRYGRDQGATLAGLLRGLAEEPGLPARLRLSSIEPPELSDELLSVMAAPSFCPHFHLPVQSGDRRVLRRMGRTYTPEDVQDLIARIISRLPAAAVGIDLIAGFPGETHAEHQNTLRLASELPLAYFHVFPFSARPGTSAAQLPDQVPPEVKKERAAELRRLGAEKKRKFLQAQKGRKLMALAESRLDGLVTGTTENYVRVKFPAGPEVLGRLVPLRVEKISGRFTIGKTEDF